MKHLLLATTILVSVATGPAPLSPTASPDPCPMPAGITAPSGGYFTASGQQIIDPSGTPFVVRGLNVEWPFLKMAIADSKANPADLKFHGLNLIRVNIFDADVSPQTIAELQAYIATTTPLGIILLLEYHEYPGIATGDTLSKVADMYRQLAAAAKGNGYVWFATQNEPSTGGSVSDINNEIRTIYNAVRSTGNNTVVLVNPYGGYNPQGTDLSGMTNVGWDLHYYAWLPNSGTPLASEVAQAKAVANIPPVIGEYGPASGNGIDSGGNAVVQEVHNSGLSSIAWAWRTQNPGNPAPGDLLYAGWDAGAALTDFGNQVASHIQQGGTPTPGTYDPQAFSQQTCQLSQAIYPNALQDEQNQLNQAMQQQQQVGQGQPLASSGQTNQPIIASSPSPASPTTQTAPQRSTLTSAVSEPGVTTTSSTETPKPSSNVSTQQSQYDQMQAEVATLQQQEQAILSDQSFSPSTTAPPPAATAQGVAQNAQVSSLLQQVQAALSQQRSSISAQQAAADTTTAQATEPPQQPTQAQPIRSGKARHKKPDADNDDD